MKIDNFMITGLRKIHLPYRKIVNNAAYLIAILLLFTSEKNYAQTTRTLYDHDILFGKVKEVFQIEYMPGYKATPAVSDTVLYDENEKTVEMREKPRFAPIYIFEYLYSQDSSGRKILVKINNEDEVISARLDDKGNLTEYNFYRKNAQLNKKSYYKYDDNDNLVLFTLKNRDNTIGLTRTYKYNQDNMQIEEDESSSDGKLNYQLIYKYVSFDKYGNWTKRTSKKKLPNGEIGDFQTVERQIVYY